MLSVKDLRTLVTKLSEKDFYKQLGPFVLVQRPPGTTSEEPTPLGLPANVARTRVVNLQAMSSAALSLLFQFDDLVVAAVPPLRGKDELTVGRQPDNDLVLDDPSVSKSHAVLRWDAEQQRCTVQDTESTNGTFLNASIRIKRETILKNGDILSFGEVQYWFLLTKTLREKLTQAPARDVGV